MCTRLCPKWHPAVAASEPAVCFLFSIGLQRVTQQLQSPAQQWRAVHTASHKQDAADESACCQQHHSSCWQHAVVFVKGLMVWQHQYDPKLEVNSKSHQSN